MKKLIALGLLIALLVIAAENYHPIGKAVKTDDDTVDMLAQKLSLSQQINEEEMINPQDAVEDSGLEITDSPSPQASGNTESPSTSQATPSTPSTSQPTIPPTTPTNPEPTPPATPAPPPATPNFDAGTLLSSVRSQVGGFMTHLDGPSNGMGYFEFSLGTHLSQDKIIADLVSAYSGEASRGNIYFDIVYLGAWSGNHHFQCYRAM